MFYLNLPQRKIKVRLKGSCSCQLFGSLACALQRKLHHTACQLHPFVFFSWEPEQLPFFNTASCNWKNSCLRRWRIPSACGAFFVLTRLGLRCSNTGICFCMHQFLYNYVKKQLPHWDRSGQWLRLPKQLAIAVTLHCTLSFHLFFVSTCLKLTYKIVVVSIFYSWKRTGGAWENTVILRSSKWLHCWNSCSCPSDRPPPRCFTGHLTRELINKGRGLLNSIYSFSKHVAVILAKHHCCH